MLIKFDIISVFNKDFIIIAIYYQCVKCDVFNKDI